MLTFIESYASILYVLIKYVTRVWHFSLLTQLWLLFLLMA